MPTHTHAIQLVVKIVDDPAVHGEAVERTPWSEMQLRGDESGNATRYLTPVPCRLIDAAAYEEEIIAVRNPYMEQTICRVTSGRAARTVVIRPADVDEAHAVLAVALDGSHRSDPDNAEHRLVDQLTAGQAVRRS